MHTSALPSRVAEAWGLVPDRVQVTKMPGGFSGAEVFHCQGVDGTQTALRCWPQGTTAIRIREVQHVVRQARRRDCTFVPDIVAPDSVKLHSNCSPDSFLTTQNRHWEMLQWMQGQPWSAQAPESQTHEKALEKAAAAVGQFHASVRGLERREECPATIIERCHRLTAAEHFFRHPPLPYSGSGLPHWIVLADIVVRDVWSRQANRLQLGLERARSQVSEVQYVLRDCHDQHVLFDKTNQVSGLIDFDALRVDTPATDLARLVYSFAALSQPQHKIAVEGAAEPSIPSWWHWVDHDLWAAAMAGFRQHCSFSDQQDELARLIADVSALFSLVNWVEWVAHREPGSRRIFSADSKLVQDRVEHLTRFAVNYFLSGLV